MSKEYNDNHAIKSKISLERVYTKIEEVQTVRGIALKFSYFLAGFHFLYRSVAIKWIDKICENENSHYARPFVWSVLMRSRRNQRKDVQVVPQWKCSSPLTPRGRAETTKCGHARRRLLLAYPTRFSAIFTRSGYFRLIPWGVRRPRAWRQDIVDRSRTEHFLIKNVLIRLVWFALSRLLRAQWFFMRTAKTLIRLGRMPRLIWVFAGRTGHFFHAAAHLPNPKHGWCKMCLFCLLGIGDRLMQQHCF